MNHFNFRGRVFRPALRRAGLRLVRVHDLRHSAASIWLAAGVDIAEVSRALGHKTPLVTMGVYAHWVQQRASNSLAAKAEAFPDGRGKRLRNGCCAFLPVRKSGVSD